MTGTDVQVFAQSSLQDRYKWAEVIARAGDLIPKGFRNPDGSGNAAKVLLAVETGNQLGLHPMAALNGIHVIDGKPTLSAALMSALVRRAGHTLLIRGTGDVKAGTYAATARLIRRDMPDQPFEATWTKDRADRAGLTGKAVWKNYFEAMAKARAISEVCRDGASDVLLGVIYTPEELDADVDGDGDILEGEVVDEATGEINPGVPVRPAYDAEAADRWNLRVRSAGTRAALLELRRSATDERVLWRRDGQWDGIWLDDPDGPLGGDAGTLAAAFKAQADALDTAAGDAA